MDFVEQLIEERKKHLARVQAINLLLEAYGHKEFDSNSQLLKEDAHQYKKGKRFPKGGTYLEQIKFIFKNENRFLHNAEITKIIAEQDNVEDIDWLKRRVSAVLSKIKRDNDIEDLISYKFGKATKDTVWGFAYWLDDNDNIKDKYMYGEKP